MSYVAIKIGNEIDVHMAPNGVSDYDTACGIDGDDEVLDQSVVPVPRGAKINCYACRSIWLAAQGYSSEDFVFGKTITVAAPKAACRWVDQDDYWQTDCGELWTLIADGPAENGMNYCPKCGRPLVVETAVSEEAS